MNTTRREPCEIALPDPIDAVYLSTIRRKSAKADWSFRTCQGSANKLNECLQVEQRQYLTQAPLSPCHRQQAPSLSASFKAGNLDT